MTFEPNYAGEFLKTYRPPLLSLNTTLNYLLTKRVVFHPSAVIVRDVQFPDVSFYQRDIDWDIMAANTRAVIIRLGQNSWIDEKFERNYAEAKSRGLLVGGYWFYDGRASPGKQADLIISLLRDKKLDLELYADWEKNYGGAYEGLPNVVSMMQYVESASYDLIKIKDIGMYTGYYFFRANSNPITHANQYNYLRSKPLWEAWYTSNPANVLIPAPWSNLTHWQFGTPVVYWGQATSELDMNFYNGSRQDFDTRYGVSTPGDNVQIIKGTVKQNILLRTGPNSSYPQTTWNGKNYLSPGQTIEADRNEFQWLHLTKIDGQPVTGEVWSSAGSSQQYISWNWETVPDEPPPPPPPPPPTEKKIVKATLFYDDETSEDLFPR